MKMEKRNNVYVTSDYDEFKLLDANRDPKKATRINKIKRSINEVGQIPTPIIVNEHFEVIDGQARLQVFKELGLPVYFMIVPGTGIPECISVNQASTAWNTTDYIDSYAAQGDENYRFLKRAIERFQLPLRTIIYAYTGLVSVPLPKIKKGYFHIDDSRIADGYKMLCWLHDNIDVFEGIKGHVSSAQVALLFCWEHASIDNSRMVKVLRAKKHELASFSMIEDWLGMFENLYNNNLSQKNRVYCRDEYKKTVAARTTNYEQRWGNRG